MKCEMLSDHLRVTGWRAVVNLLMALATLLIVLVRILMPSMPPMMLFRKYGCFFVKLVMVLSEALMVLVHPLSLV